MKIKECTYSADMIVLIQREEQEIEEIRQGKDRKPFLAVAQDVYASLPTTTVFLLQ